MVRHGVQDNCQYVVFVSNGIIKTFDNDRPNTFTSTISIGTIIKGLAVTRA